VTTVAPAAALLRGMAGPVIIDPLRRREDVNVFVGEGDGDGDGWLLLVVVVLASCPGNLDVESEGCLCLIKLAVGC
jgi:hypothetical protein